MESITHGAGHAHAANHACSRRLFLGGAIGCGAHIMMTLAAGGFTRSAMGAAVPGEKVSESPFARVEKVADGVWAIISTPWTGNMTTLSNGGIVAGSQGVAVIEGYNTPAGAAWVHGIARELTGRPATHVIITHYHADHSAGLPGCQSGGEGPAIVSTATTRRLLLENLAPAGETAPKEGEPFLKAQRLLLPDSVITNESDPTDIDLGGRVLRVTPRQGHTASDVTVEVAEPRVFWCGDLVFNGMFPYFGDAMPSRLGQNCNAMLKDPDTLYVPGHGVATDADGLGPYLHLLEDVEAAARKAHEAGIPPADGAAIYKLPESLSSWIVFRPDFFQLAFEAWEKELTGTA